MASLASRISGEPIGITTEGPSKSWAEEMASPTQPTNPPAPTMGLDGVNDMQTESRLDEPEYDVDVKLSEIMERQDANNPLYSVKRFEELGLRDELLRGLYGMNFQKPSKIQEKALPLLLLNPPRNLVGQSQSGTGKTAAFVLNILSRIDLSKPEAPQALVLAPTRELARQIMSVVQTMGAYLPGLKVAYAIPQSIERGSKVNASVVVGTPGTVMDLMRRKQLAAADIKVFVLDEADNMLDQQGLGEQCARVRQLLSAQNPQYVLFSATFPENVKQYTAKFAPGANHITLKHEELTVEGIRQVYMDCDSEQHKFEVLVKLYGLMTVGSSIIFVKRRDIAMEIQKRMEAEGHVVAALHGAQEGADRDRVIDAFRSGSAKVLITTNVLARGIDVQTVTMVVNYDLPELQNGHPDCETYLHRIGRTGRFGRVGVSISFVSDKKSWSQMDEIQRFFGVEMISVPTTDWDETEEKLGKIIRSARAGSNLVGAAKPIPAQAG